MNYQKDTLTVPDGTELFIQWWTPDASPKDIIVVSHGYAEHSGRYQHVAEYFVEQGYAVYTLDHRGHGQSRGEEFGYFDRFASVVDDLAFYIEWIRAQQKGVPLFLLGHSVGALISLHYAERSQAMLKGLILSAAYLLGSADIPTPLRISVQLLSRIVPKVGVTKLDSQTISRDQGVVNAYDSDPNVSRTRITARVATEITGAVDSAIATLSRITLPVLILHGGADQLAPPRCSQIISDGVGSRDKTLKIYDGLYHEILNEPEKARVLADIWVWLASHHGTSELRPPAADK